MKKLFVIIAFLILPLTSQALFEVRAGYGSLTTDEDTYGANNLGKLEGYNLDFIFEPPVITDLGLGIRYEKLEMDFGANDAELERISALINYRIIDFVAYFGVIGSIGLSNDFSIGANDNFDEKLNYSIGLEGGMNLGLFLIGAEIGKMFAEVENPGFSDIDISGIYGKVLVGFGF